MSYRLFMYKQLVMDIHVLVVLQMKHGEIVSTAEECHEEFNCRNCIERIRGSRQLVLFIVFFALLLDNMLMTVIGKYFILGPSEMWWGGVIIFCSVQTPLTHRVFVREVIPPLVLCSLYQLSSACAARLYMFLCYYTCHNVYIK